MITKWFRQLIDTRRQAQINKLVTKAARRCVRDFGHAIAAIPDPTEAEIFNQRHRYWCEIFWDTSQYRDSVHHHMDHQEREIARLTKLLDDNKIDHTALPF